jgi:hypothetical protein
VVYVFDGFRWKAYLNGLQVVTGPIHEAGFMEWFSSPNTLLTFGSATNAITQWTGELYLVALYAAELRDDMVMTFTLHWY